MNNSDDFFDYFCFLPFDSFPGCASFAFIDQPCLKSWPSHSILLFLDHLILLPSLSGVLHLLPGHVLNGSRILILQWQLLMTLYCFHECFLVNSYFTRSSLYCICYYFIINLLFLPPLPFKWVTQLLLLLNECEHGFNPFVVGFLLEL